ncbi:hypothetical protein KGQ19_47865 [Catenulispora sp. NL8]|uniref:Uncharacterized protein n=1 Tax=Catenulispora pinistramenti TaxID=2705254 RepID=A0ABS5L8B0_9ACTN|nr:hypothetical protein [Catenulispora pinistramenti]MBS2554598.1 hypothetical protein [Catenulispora pinistramenti]
MSEVTKKSTDPRPAERAPVPPSIVRKAVVASAMGNAMEWLDYGAFTPGTITGSSDGCSSLAKIDAEDEAALQAA